MIGGQPKLPEPLAGLCLGFAEKGNPILELFRKQRRLRSEDRFRKVQHDGKSLLV